MDAVDGGDGAGPAPKTAGDFTIVNGGADSSAQLQQALDYLQQTDASGNPVSQTAFDLLQSMPPGANISIIDASDPLGDRYDPTNNTIYWDPTSALIVPDGMQSPALGLAHEMDHMVNGLPNPQPTNDGYENTEEQRVIQGSETQIANDLGEPTRTDHGGTPVEVQSPSDAINNTGLTPPIDPSLPGPPGYVAPPGPYAPDPSPPADPPAAPPPVDPSLPGPPDPDQPPGDGGETPGGDDGSGGVDGGGGEVDGGGDGGVGGADDGGGGGEVDGGGGGDLQDVEED